MGFMGQLGSAMGFRGSRPQFSPLLDRSSSEMIGAAQSGLQPGYTEALRLQNMFGVPTTQAELASARAGAPEQTQYALQGLSDLQNNSGVPGRMQGDFLKALRARQTSGLGEMGAQQVLPGLQEAEGVSAFGQQLAQGYLGMLPNVGPTDIFGRSAPSFDTGLTLEMQRGMDDQARLNAMSQYNNAQNQRLQSMYTGGAMALGGMGAGALMPSMFGAQTAGQGGFMGGMSGMNMSQGGGPMMMPQRGPQFNFSYTGAANRPTGQWNTAQNGSMGQYQPLPT